MNKVSPHIHTCLVKVKLVRIKCHPLSVQARLFKLGTNVNKAIEVKLVRIKCHPLSVQIRLFELDREM